MSHNNLESENIANEIILATDKYHEFTCYADHPDGCGYTDGSSGDFDVKYSPKNSARNDYLHLKKTMERILGKELTHEEALQTIRAVTVQVIDG